jgi:hypothetical protein
MSDIIGYARSVQEEDGGTRSILYMRGTTRYVAGSRFKYTPDFIEFTYDNLVNAIGDAIDKQAEETNGKFVTNERTTAHVLPPELDYDALMAQFKDIVAKIQDAAGDRFAADWAPRIVEITDRHLGKGKKVNDMTRDQVEMLDLIVSDLIDIVGLGI